MNNTVAQKLPDVWVLACNLATDVRAGKVFDWAVLFARIQPLLELDSVEQVARVLPNWKDIASAPGGRTAKHILTVLVASLNLPEYESASLQARQEMEWAALFHDLDKKYARRDAAHPFRSAALAACSMPALGFELCPGVGLADVKAWSNWLMLAQREEGVDTFPDHTHLAEIIAGLHTLWGNASSAARILKAIMFHQSLPTLADWPNPVLLTEAEVKNYLSPADMEVLGALMLADCEGWNLFEPMRLEYLAELRANLSATRGLISV